ncbi:MAG: tetratricopeptide repeat protein, partial [Myxococcota bacterium]
MLISRTPRSRVPARALLVLVLCAVSAPAAAAAAEVDAPAEVRARALRLALEGRCTAALPELDAARLADPGDALLALRAGQCRLRQHRYGEAARDLEAATRLAPERGDAWLALAKARYHARDLQGAGAALDEAQRRLPDDAEVALYRGMLLVESGDDAEAIAAFERARSLDAERVEPVASHQIALARARTHDVEGAEDDLVRLRDTWRGTDWSTRAERDLDRLRAGRARHAWLGLGAGVEYDSNVVLRGRGVPRPADIGDDDDARGVWTGSGGVELFKTERTTLGLMGSYRGTTHVDLYEYDAHFPSVTAWVDWAAAEGLVANARYDFGYAWLDGNPFVATSNWQVSLLQTASEWGESQVYVRTHLDDYFFRSDDV